MDDTLREDVCFPTTSKDKLPDSLMSTTNAEENIFNQIECLDSDVSASDQRNYVVVEDPLSNFPILRNIFRMLDDEDLEICRKVCKYWRTVADLMMSTRYDVQLGRCWMLEDERPYFGEKDYVLIKKRDRQDRRNFTEIETSFEGAIKTLEEDLQSPKISICLTVKDHVDIRGGRGHNFFSKFGHLVLDLNFAGYAEIPLNSFSKLIIEEFPNLRKLNFSALVFDENSLEDQTFSPDLDQNVQRNLRKIYFSRRVRSIQTAGKMLKMFPNLETIEHLNWILIEDVAEAEKGHALKSLSSITAYSRELHGDRAATVLKATEKLAQFQPKLATFSLFPHSIEYSLEPRGFRTLKSSIFSILQSSSESLKSLSITPTRGYDWQPIPKMTGLKSLQLIDSRVEFMKLGGDMEFFPGNISLKEIIPNVTNFSLAFDYPLEECWINQYLAENVFSPWGSQIIKLKLRSVSKEILTVLRKLFPNALEIQLQDFGTEASMILLELSHLWPKLKFLTIRAGSRPFLLDPDFTGLSLEVVDQLLDPIRRKNFAHSQIQGFKDESPMSKFKGLKNLRILVPYSELNSQTWKLITPLTPISNEFGFNLLPDLKVTVEICPHQAHLKALKNVLEPLAESGNIDVVVRCGCEGLQYMY